MEWALGDDGMKLKFTLKCMRLYHRCDDLRKQQFSSFMSWTAEHSMQWWWRGIAWKYSHSRKILHFFARSTVVVHESEIKNINFTLFSFSSNSLSRLNFFLWEFQAEFHAPWTLSVMPCHAFSHSPEKW